MQLKLSQTLRALRREKNITQEALAVHLGITAQSVGKWERDEGYPDITLLPAIALYFGVTLDRLLGIDEARIRKTVDAYEAESQALLNAGRTEDAIALWRRAYAELPTDNRVRKNLADALFFGNPNNFPDKDERYAQIISLGEDVLRECTDNAIRSGTIQILAFTYDRMGQKARALEYASMMPYYPCTVNEVKRTILDGEEAVSLCQSNLMQLTDMIALNAYVMSWKGKYTDEQKLKIYTFIIDTYRRLYSDGNYGFYTCRMAQYLQYVAHLSAKLGRYEECLTALEQMQRFAKQHDTSTGGMYTALLVNHEVYCPDTTTRNYTVSERERCREELSSKVYDPIRTHPRFIAVAAGLEE